MTTLVARAARPSGAGGTGVGYRGACGASARAEPNAILPALATAHGVDPVHVTEHTTRGPARDDRLPHQPGRGQRTRRRRDRRPLGWRAAVRHELRRAQPHGEPSRPRARRARCPAGGAGGVVRAQLARGLTTVHAAPQGRHSSRCPLSYRFTAEEMQYVVDNSDATTVVIDAEQAPLLASVRDRLPKVREIVVYGGDVPDGCVDWDELLAASPRDRAHPRHRPGQGRRLDDLHLRDHRPPEGRAADDVATRRRSSRCSRRCGSSPARRCTSPPVRSITPVR